MDQEIQFDNPLPQPVVEAARDLYAPPKDPAYWETLESRVMARIAAVASNTVAAPIRWWQVLNGWTRGGMVAAAAVLVVVGLLLMHAHSEDVKTASEAGLRATPAEAISVPSGLLSDDGDARGETLRDVISR